MHRSPADLTVAPRLVGSPDLRPSDLVEACVGVLGATLRSSSLPHLQHVDWHVQHLLDRRDPQVHAVALVALVVVLEEEEEGGELLLVDLPRRHPMLSPHPCLRHRVERTPLPVYI